MAVASVAVVTGLAETNIDDEANLVHVASFLRRPPVPFGQAPFLTGAYGINLCIFNQFLM